MKNVKTIAGAAMLALVFSTGIQAKSGTISATKTGTISATRTGTISATRTAPVTNIDTLQLGLIQLLMAAFQIW